MAVTMDTKVLYPRKVILNDGTTFDGSGSLNSDGDTLVITLDEGWDMGVAFSAFNDLEKTKVIKTTIESLLVMDSKEEYEYKGFTRFMNLGISGSELRIILKRPVGEA